MCFKECIPKKPGWYEFVSNDFIQAAYWDGETWKVRRTDVEHRVALPRDALVLRYIGE